MTEEYFQSECLNDLYRLKCDWERAKARTQSVYSYEAEAAMADIEKAEASLVELGLFVLRLIVEREPEALASLEREWRQRLKKEKR